MDNSDATRFVASFFRGDCVIMFSGYCTECGDEADGRVYPDLNFYCHPCADRYELRNRRCRTIAFVYDMKTGKRLSSGTSILSGGACAERNALWLLDPKYDCVEKRIVVTRYRSDSRFKKTSMGESRPCAQCTLTMAFYNVKRIKYSTKKGYVETDLDALYGTSYQTMHQSILVL